ncbi:hypothetical protein NX794_18290 [Streptomyces sp. LP11]|uniref:PE-PGRS family protein n=1 Tax=Streptomyces pyxinicus TaxID=2970331 RepID=A0ABT2B3R3_9ACTN|nr:hypothetical protein [Streptomyces sp. LP11]MCS0603146.1 hypothetical protein [Streptomyces sp. LP11]
MTAGWCSRAVRAAVFAAVCVVLAALGHVLMSGRDVPVWALAAGLAATGGVGWCLTGRERGPGLIVPLVVAAQTALHSAFSFAQSVTGGATGAPAGSTAPGMSGTDMAGMAHMGAGHMGAGTMDAGHTAMAHMGTGDVEMAHRVMGDMGMDSMTHLGHSMDGGWAAYGMVAAHLLAALVTGVWLAHGERAAFRILRAVAGRLAAPLRLLLALPAVGHRPDPAPRRPRSERAPSLGLLTHAITSRGPPVGTAVA